MIATDTAQNGTNGHNAPASFLVEKMLAATERIGDGKPATPGAAPLHGQFPLPHVLTFQSIIGSISKVYRANDEAIRNSIDNARFMRNDCGVMECVEARQRAVSLLGWHIEPEDKKSQRQKDLCTEITKIISRIPRFDMYRYVLSNAAWYGRYAIQNQYNWVNVGGRYYCLPHPEHGDHEGLGWLPINGDKIVFRYDDGTLDPERPAGQVGIRVGAFKAGDTIGGKWKVEATDRGMAYFLSPEERRNIAIHKHAIEDGAYEAAVDAGMLHGVGIRSRIYWDWFQKQECLAFLMEYLQRSAGGIELWYYDEGNPKAKAETEQAATNRVSNGGRNIILVPRPRGEDAMAYGVQLVEPGVQGVAELKDLLTNYFGHRIKRYILGQTLTSEADATGLGSGVAAAHIDTFMQIVKFDANGIDETLTRQLVRQIQLYNFPSSVGVWLRFKTETESPDVDKKLDACNTAFQMGARFKESDILDMVGMEAPGPDDRPLQSPAFQQQPGMEGMPGAGGASMPGMGKAGNDGASLMADKLHPTTVAVAMSASEETKRALFGGGKTSNPAADTGDRVRETDPEQYARSGDKCPVCPSCGSDNTSHARTKGDANAECQECGNQFTDPDDGRPKSADEAAAETDRNPSDEQRASGNYRKGKFRVHGLTIAIETPKGAERRGKNREGQEWSVTMPVHYGYINRTEGKDGDHVDVFVGPHPESEIVFVVDQTTNGGRFDEHKVLLGFTTEEEACTAYVGAYSDNAARRVRAVTPMTVQQFKAWLQHGDQNQPIEGQVSRYAKFASGQKSLVWNEEDHPREADGTFAEKGHEASPHHPDEHEKYADYVKTMGHIGLKPRSLDEWVGAYREQQARLKPKDEKPAESKPEESKAAEKEPEKPADEPTPSEERHEGEKQGETLGEKLGDSPENSPDIADPPSQQALFSEAIDEGASPREAADKATREDDPEYQFARVSSVRNAGEDLKGSARHKVNAWRGLAEAEADGSAEAMVTRDNLLKAEPHGLMNHVEENPITAMAMHLAIKKLPPAPGYGNERRRSRVGEDEKKKDRAQFVEAYKSVKEKAEELARTENDPVKALAAMKTHVKDLIKKLRGQNGDSATAVATASDPYNNTANSLVNTLNSLGTSPYDARKSTNVVHHLGLFAKEFKDKYPDLSGSDMKDKTIEHASDVIEGASVASAFGKGGGKANRKVFNSADKYVKHAKRTGGPDISSQSSDPNRATEYMVKDLGMRGVQWGNSVTDEERAHHAKNVAEAFADLTDILGIDPADASLGGKLGLAIGARGHGTFSAHYEPGNKVINLTRKSGVGALAHEWGHGFDHMLSNFGTSASGADYYSERVSPQRFAKDENGRLKTENGKLVTEDVSGDPLWKAYDGLRKSWKDSGFKKRLGSAVTKYVHNGVLSEDKRKYWTSDREVFARTFERYVQRKLEKDGRSNTYLTGLAGEESSSPDSFWPSDAEVDAMTPHFDAIFEAHRKAKGGSGEPKKYRRDDLVRYFLGDRTAVEHYDKPESLDAIPDSAGKPATKKGGKGGSWVRLGGGAPAFVGPDGTIKKGCPGLKGENVDDLIDEPEESRDRRAAKQAHAEAKGVKGHEVTATETKKWEGQGAQRQHDAAKAAAKRHGVNVADVIQGLPEALSLRLAQWDQTEQARAAARRLAGMNAGNLARVENAYRDYSSVPGFDEAAASFAMEHPEMGLGRSGDVAAELWDFIREGAAPKPAIHDEETADMAAGMVGRRGQEPEQPEGDFADEWAVDDDSFDPSRFRRPGLRARYDAASSSWDESKHPRGQPGNAGQFGPVHGAEAAGSRPEGTRPESGGSQSKDAKKSLTKSKAFKSWFGDWESDPQGASKVVDDDGTPKETYEVKKVYHGTLNNFDSFDPMKSGANGNVVGHGFYFAENEQIAKQYAQGGGKIVEAYLNIRNPFMFDAVYSLTSLRQIADTVGKWWTENRPQSEMSAADVSKEIIREFGRNMGSNDWASGYAVHKSLSGILGKGAVNDVIRSLGHDGIMHDSRDTAGTPRVTDKQENHGRVWIAFEPTQIKSTDNRGTFDPNDKRMDYSKRIAPKTYSWNRT